MADFVGSSGPHASHNRPGDRLGRRRPPRGSGATGAHSPSGRGRPSRASRCLARSINGLDEAQRADWLWFANRCNEAGLLVKFALVASDEGGHMLRASAFGAATYERASFGAFMDVWHRDLTLMEHAPSPEQAGEDDESDEEDEDAVSKEEVRH